MPESKQETSIKNMSSNRQADKELKSVTSTAQGDIADVLKEQHAKTFEKLARQRGEAEGSPDFNVVSPKGYLLKLTYEATRYAAQLFTSGDEGGVEIISFMHPENKTWNTHVIVPDEKLDFFDTIRLLGDFSIRDHESQEASNEACVFDLYQEVWAKIKPEDRLLPNCLATAGEWDACTRDEYDIHFNHLKKEAQRESKMAVTKDDAGSPE